MKNQEKLLFLDIELSYLPLEIYKYNLIKSIKNNFGNHVDYFSLNLKDFCIKNKKEKIYIKKRLYEIKKNKEHKRALAYSIINLPKNLILIFFKNIWFINIFINSEVYGKKIIKFKDSKNLIIGDCICSHILKQAGSRGYIHKSIKQYIFVYKFLIRYGLYIGVINYLKKRYEKKFFYCVETSYLDEAIRRYLINENFKEISYDYIIGRTVELPKMLGYEIRKGDYQRKTLISNNIFLDIEKAELNLKNLLNRKVKYSYLLGMDVDINQKFIIENISTENAVIYLHAVSDAQYFYGTDFFIDLHDWLMQSIKLLIKYGYTVFIKMHPSYFSSQHNYPVDAEYLKYLEEVFDINFSKLKINEPNKTNRKNIYFVSHQISIIELNDKLPNHLCITHHGTIATEAAYLSLPVLVSSASPYTKNIDKFLEIYSTLDEYELLIIKYKKKYNIKVDRNSLYAYIAYTSLIKSFYLEKMILDIFGVDVIANISVEAENYLLDLDDKEINKIDNIFSKMAEIL